MWNHWQLLRPTLPFSSFVSYSDKPVREPNIPSYNAGSSDHTSQDQWQPSLSSIKAKAGVSLSVTPSIFTPSWVLPSSLQKNLMTWVIQTFLILVYCIYCHLWKGLHCTLWGGHKTTCFYFTYNNVSISRILIHPSKLDHTLSVIEKNYFMEICQY